MPRSGRGGRVTPTAGVARPNRTDLQAAPSPEPISTVPGQGYGDAAAQQVAQRAIPLAGTPTAAPAPGGGAAPPIGQPPAAAQGPYPGELPFTGPTQRPNEPVTAGLNRGPGPGTEANIGVGSAGFVHSNVSNLLNALAQVPGATPDVAALASYASSKA